MYSISSSIIVALIIVVSLGVIDVWFLSQGPIISAVKNVDRFIVFAVVVIDVDVVSFFFGVVMLVLVHMRSLVRDRESGRGTIVGGGISVEVGKFGVIDGREVVGERNISGGTNRSGIVTVVFVVEDGVVGPPLNDEARLLNDGLVFELRESLDAGDGSVRHGKDGPAVSCHAKTGGEREEEVVAVHVTRRGKSDGPKCVRAGTC
jgi:hypothetical protein